MISNNFQNQPFSFLDSVATTHIKSNALDKESISDSNSDFEQIANDTITSANKDTKISAEDTAKIYKAAQAVIKKLEDCSEGQTIEITEEEVADFKDVYFLVLNTVQTQVEDKVDSLTKEIAYLDLTSINGIEDILVKANLIEDLRAVGKGAEDGLKQLAALASPEELEANGIDLGLMKDIKFQVNNFMEKTQNEILANNHSNDIHPEITLAPDLKPNANNQGYQDRALIQDLKELKIQSYKEAPSMDTLESIDVELRFAKSDAEENSSPLIEKPEPQTKEPEILALETNEHSNTSSDSASSSSHDQFGTAFAKPTQVNLDISQKANVKFETVNINDLSNYLKDQIQSAPQNKAQEIRLQITPDSIGKIDLVITKNEHNEISIEMSFHNKAGLDTIKQELKNIIAELREVLKSKDLDLSKFEVKESSSSHTASDGSHNTTSFNQAREQQKHKLQNTIPEWVKSKESTTQASFKQIIEGI